MVGTHPMTGNGLKLDNMVYANNTMSETVCTSKTGNAAIRQFTLIRSHTRRTRANGICSAFIGFQEETHRGVVTVKSGVMNATSQ